MATNYDTTTVPGIHVPTAANNGNNFAAGILQMAEDQQAAYLPAGWMSLALGSGINGAGSTATPSARNETHDVVRLRGWLHNNSGSSITGATTLATIPIGLRPLRNISLDCIIQSPVSAVSVAVLLVGADGTIALPLAISLPAGDAVILDGRTFDVD